MIITKRNPKFTLLHSTIAILGIMVYSPIFLLYTSNLHPLLTKYAFYGDAVVYPLVAYAFLWGLATKYWILSFKINWIKCTQNATWKMHINQLQMADNCFLKHKNTLGSTRYIQRYIFIIYTLYILSFYAVIIFAGALTIFYSMSQLVLLFIPTAIVIFAW